ncbi:DUF654-domain-containing protein [Wallemia mellicola]|uniref:DUF654-domain-containing protein n=1 Tax=Wallemia mellicola TaxID=1708541 RepID=A0A4T0M1D7_9BASI|nr:DUF654-domain-containing protein [Wallemia mellicola]
MSNARRLRQQRELESLKSSTPDLETPEDEVAEEKPSKVGNPFAALGAEEDNNSEDEEEEGEEEEDASTLTPTAPAAKKKNKNKKKKKSKGVQQAASAQPPQQPVDDKTYTSNRQAKLARKKQRGLNEIDQALQELNIKYPEQQQTTQTSDTKQNSTISTLKAFLGIDPKQLDASAEMKKMFGAKVVSSATSMNSYGMGRQGRNQRAQAAFMKAMPRSHLAKYKPTWPPPTVAKLDGIGMRTLTLDEMKDWRVRHNLDDSFNLGGSGNSGDGNWWTFVHEPQYKSVQRQFLDATGSFDPNTLMALLQVYPYHVDTLNQVSEVFRMQGDNSNASDFTERVLFAIERAFPTNFNVLSGQCRLDFDRVENRSIWLALTRLINHLCMKGCWRTAFEYAKLMLSLDPLTDPYGALNWIDFLAVKAGQHDWIIRLAKEWPYNNTTNSGVVDCAILPGVAYAKALAVYYKEKPSKQLDETVNAFEEAISEHPIVLEQLRDNGLITLSQSRNEKLNQTIKANEEHYAKHAGAYHARNIALAKVYYAHSHPLYRDPNIPLQEIINRAIDNLETTREEQVKNAEQNIIRKSLKVYKFPENVARHVIINNLTDAKQDIPQVFSEGDAFDPVRPSTSASGYNDAYFTGVRTRGGPSDSAGPAAGGIMSFIESLLRGEFNVNDLGRMDPNMRVVLEDQINELQQAGMGGMPGGFGEDEPSEDSESEEESDTEQSDPSLVERMSRMIGLNRGNDNDDNVD